MYNAVQHFGSGRSSDSKDIYIYANDISNIHCSIHRSILKNVLQLPQQIIIDINKKCLSIRLAYLKHFWRNAWHWRHVKHIKTL